MTSVKPGEYFKETAIDFSRYIPGLSAVTSEGLTVTWIGYSGQHLMANVPSMAEAERVMNNLTGYSELKLLKTENVPFSQVKELAALERKQADERKEDESEYERLRKKLGK